MSDVLFRDENERVASKFKPGKLRRKDRDPSAGDSPLLDKQSDQTRAVIANSRNQRPAEPPIGSSDCLGQEERNSTFYVCEDGPARWLSPTLESIAVHFLLDDYLRSSHFKYLPALYSTCHTETSLDLLLKAAAFSSLSQRSNRPELETQARQYHAKGVTEVRFALTQPKRAVTDEVLAAVLLLTLYETLNTSTPATLSAWSTHAQGALALLVLRGNAQFATKAGKAMFMQVSKMAMMFCIRCRVRVPEELRALMHDNQTHRDNAFQTRNLHGGTFFEDFVAFNADMAAGVLVDAWDIIAHGDGLLERLEQTMLTLPFQEQYYRISERSKKPGPGPWSPYAAQVWANAWMAQLALYEIMGRKYQSLGLPANLHQLGAIRAAEDIYVTVEQLFPSSPIISGTSVPGPGTLDPAAGFFSIWPLFNAGSSWCVDAEFREKVIGKLQYIGALLALPQAKKAAQTLADGYSQEDWMHMYHVF